MIFSVVQPTKGPLLPHYFSCPSLIRRCGTKSQNLRKKMGCGQSTEGDVWAQSTKKVVRKLLTLLSSSMKQCYQLYTTNLITEKGIHIIQYLHIFQNFELVTL